MARETQSTEPATDSGSSASLMRSRRRLAGILFERRYLIWGQGGVFLAAFPGQGDPACHVCTPTSISHGSVEDSCESAEGPQYSCRAPIRRQTSTPCPDLAMTNGTNNTLIPNRLNIHSLRLLYRPQGRWLQVGMHCNRFKFEFAYCGFCRRRINEVASGFRYLHGGQEHLRCPPQSRPSVFRYVARYRVPDYET